MKKIFFTLVAIMTATLSFAQNTSCANLYHEGNVSTYYGSGALVSAVAAAVDGDIVTLSTGSFNGATIDKNITVRGAGWDKTDAAITSITSPAYFEGIRFSQTLKPAGSGKLEFMKCYFSQEVSNENWTDGAMNFYSSHSNYYLTCRSTCKVACINSIINRVSVWDENTSFNCINCVVVFQRIGFQYESTSYGYYWYSSENSNANNNSYYYSTPGKMQYSSFENCILYCLSGYSNYRSSEKIFPSTVIATNNLSNCAIFQNPDDNMVLDEAFTGVFTNGWASPLTAEAQASYTGSDGTQVGVYGGMLPFTNITNVPQITSMTVDRKVAVGNTLGVDIKLNDAE